MATNKKAAVKRTAGVKTQVAVKRKAVAKKRDLKGGGGGRTGGTETNL